MKTIILALIKIYQKTISPDHGIIPILGLFGSCRHYPYTCSEYTYDAIKEQGVLKGSWKGLKRIITCI